MPRFFLFNRVLFVLDLRTYLGPLKPSYGPHCLFLIIQLNAKMTMRCLATLISLIDGLFRTEFVRVGPQFHPILFAAKSTSGAVIANSSPILQKCYLPLHFEDLLPSTLHDLSSCFFLDFIVEFWGLRRDRTGDLLIFELSRPVFCFHTVISLAWLDWSGNFSDFLRHYRHFLSFPRKRIILFRLFAFNFIDLSHILVIFWNKFRRFIHLSICSTPILFIITQSSCRQVKILKILYVRIPIRDVFLALAEWPRNL